VKTRAQASEYLRISPAHFACRRRVETGLIVRRSDFDNDLVRDGSRLDRLREGNRLRRLGSWCFRRLHRGLLTQQMEPELIGGRELQVQIPYSPTIAASGSTAFLGRASSEIDDVGFQRHLPSPYPNGPLTGQAGALFPGFRAVFVLPR